MPTKSIAIIDDDYFVIRSLQRLFSELLKEEDCKNIAVAMSHWAAKKLIEEAIAANRSFDLILVDGVLDGYNDSLDLIPLMKGVGKSIIAISSDNWMLRQQLLAGCTEAHSKEGDLVPFLKQFCLG